MNEIWTKRDEADPKRARRFQKHHKGTYSRTRRLRDGEKIRLEVKTDRGLMRTIKNHGSILQA